MKQIRSRSFLLITFAILVGIIFWITRPVSLNPVELSLLGIWRSVPTASTTPGLQFLHDYRRDRTVVKSELNTGASPAVWTWRVEDDALIVEQQRSFFDQLVNGPAPDIGKLELISVTPEELVLGPRDSPSVFVRETD